MKSIIVLTAGLVIAASSLSGCAEMEARQAAADQQQCASYGFQQGSDQFAKCMMQVQQKRSDDWRASQAQANENKQREADRQALKSAAASLGGQSNQQPKQEPMDGFIPKSAEQGFTPSSTQPSSGTNCTSTTTSQSSDNAGTSTTTTECH